ncbi:MAG: hypothetical protein KJ674_02845 [Nanoarchaeota archaeon]|nr:hypothetical protein [Nanoarchaeota archaeon]
MEEKTRDMEQRLRNSFLNVKKEINSLKEEIEHLKYNLIEEKKQNIDLKNQLKENLDKSTEIKAISPSLDKSSIGNKGVMHSFIHSFTSYADKQTLNIQNFKESFEIMFKTLPKQEFLTFLTIYQLEDDLKRPITYLDVSSHLKLSEGCIRTYISNLLKKRVPLSKTRLNNKIVQLQINSHFRELNLKQKLISLYELSNIDQRKLIDSYE